MTTESAESAAPSTGTFEVPVVVPKRRADTIRVIGVPMDLGASRRGVDMGPSALRLAGLADRLAQLGYAVDDFGNQLERPTTKSAALPARERSH